MEWVAQFLERREKEHDLRVLSPIDRRSPARLTQSGKEYVDFSSNDYLGLSTHPDLVEAADAALKQYGVGTAASRLMSGDLKIHHTLEEETAAFKSKACAIVFNSGYQANVGIISCLVGRGDAVFADRLIHASLLDGIMLSRAELFRFRHNDTEHLEDLLKLHRKDSDKALIVTETVFSMNGDTAPLPSLVRLRERYDCIFLADEAHATGVFGPQGRGRVSEEGLADKVDLIMGTFSKALGGFGAYVAASRMVVDYLVNTARSFIYSTALPAVVIAADLAALRFCLREPERGPELLEKAGRFRQSLQDKGFTVLGSSQIVPVVVGESIKAIRLSEELHQRGLRVLPVRPPTVPEGQSRLRFSLCCAHTEEELQYAAEALSELA